MSPNPNRIYFAWRYKVYRPIACNVSRADQGGIKRQGNAHWKPHPSHFRLFSYYLISSLFILTIMETISHTSNLCSLSEWSIQHIRDVFEARSDEQSLRAITATFSDNVSATVNGAPLSREGINQLVLAMRRGSAGGLRVQWQQAVEVPRNPATNRVSFLSTHRPCPCLTFSVEWIVYRGICHPRHPKNITRDTKACRL